MIHKSDVSLSFVLFVLQADVDEYSRAMLAKKSGKGFQAVGSWLEAWFQVPTDCSPPHCPAGKNKNKEKDREKAWYEIISL